MMKTRISSVWAAAIAAAGLALAQGTPADDRIYDQVRVKLAGDRDTGGLGRLQVAVKNGEVTLTGVVDNDRQRGKAEKLAKKVKGVAKVVNNLKVDTR